MKFYKEYIVEKADGTWVPIKDGRFRKAKVDQFGRVTVGGGS